MPYEACSTQTLSISMATPTVYRANFKVCICVSFSFSFPSLPQQPLNYDNSWTSMSADKGFPFLQPPSPRQHSWVDKHWPRLELHTRGSPRKSKGFLGVVAVVAIVAGSQGACTGESRHVCLLLLLMETKAALNIDIDTPEKRHSICVTLPKQYHLRCHYQKIYRQ